MVTSTAASTKPTTEDGGSTTSVTGREQKPDGPTPDGPTPDEPTPDEPIPDESTADESTADESTADEPTLEKDDLFHLLQNQRRRRVLEYLQGTDGQVDMRDVAEQVAAWENDVDLQRLSSDERQRVYIALYQNHLPKLDEAGVLSYNQDRGIVERRPTATQLDPYLNVGDVDDATEAADHHGPVSVIGYYTVAAVASVLSMVATFFGVIATSGIALATLVTGMFTAVTIGAVLRDFGVPS